MTHPLQAQVRTLPERPGVYRFLADDGQVLYIGKARNLKNRVASYFAKNLASPRIALMVSKAAKLEITPTPSESEALLLENNLIKEYAPKYNILFRDDKSYPYIRLTREAWPMIGLHRGSLATNADYFGPYPNAWSVRDAVHLLQKIFRLRTCAPSVFNNRTRPCLLYQIRRCSAPCVALISAADYAEDVKAATLFLQGRHQEIIQRLTKLMEEAVTRLAFEQAALFRDQIQALSRVRDTQIMDSHQQSEDIDIIVAVAHDGGLCVNLAMVRGGRHLGDRPQFPQNANQLADASLSEVLSAFVEAHYARHPAPGRVLVNASVDEGVVDTLAGILGRPLPIDLPYYAQHKAWVTLAENNAQLALAQRRQMQSLQGQRQQALLAALQEAGLALEQLNRIECFDISHTQGEAAVASCVVWVNDGASGSRGGEMRRAEYRRFNMVGITPGDDYAAIHQAVYRRYKPGEPATERVERVRPDLLLIDGGRGQVAKALEALIEAGFSDLPLVGVAKGLGRKPGLESLVFADDRPPLHLAPDDPGLHLVQEIRDEAHRFALTGHRGRRQKARIASRLDDIAGVGPKRRRALIASFGSVSAIKVASIEAIAAVPGMSEELAQRVHAALQDG